VRFVAKTKALPPSRMWDLLLLLAFLPGAVYWALIVLILPAGLGSHANVYTSAAAAWLAGGDPWTVGPRTAVFAGPPPMLLPFVPFISLSIDVTRVLWFGGDLLIAIWVIRRLGMAPYWLAFPPLFAAIVLGHLEVLVLAFLLIRGPLAGVSAVIKPYAVFPLLAERRWVAIMVGVALLGATLPFLPWARFFDETPLILATLARQNIGDSTFGDPVLVVVAGISLALLGPRRALWLAAPVLWPFAQPIYKTLSMPALSPIVAIAWASPIAGATLFGVMILAILVTIDRLRPLPPWLKVGIEQVATWPPEAVGGRRAGLPSPVAG
jgi:hypothetical protein